MKKNLCIAITLLFVTGLLTNISFAQEKHKAPKKVDITQYDVKPDRHNSESKGQREIVLEEDFSLMDFGTEDQPDTLVPMVGDDYYVYPQYVHTPGWSGTLIFPAGQTAAMTDWYASFINTPEIEMAGELIVTYRARLLPDSGGTQTQMFVSLCNNGIVNPTMVDYAVHYITHEWQTLTDTLHNPESANCFIQWNAYRTYQIDDVVVSRTLNFMPTPNAEEAFDYTMEGFTTSWNNVYSADQYLVTVYKKDYNGNEPQSYEEGFDGIHNDGQWIDQNDPNYPEGWRFNLQPGTKRQIITGEGNYISAPQSVCLDADGDTIFFPNNGGRITDISFNMKLVDYSGQSGYIYYCYKDSDGKWYSLCHSPLDLIYQNHVNDWFMVDDVFFFGGSGEYEDFAIVYDGEDDAVVAIDDATWTTTAPSGINYMFQDRVVTDTSYVVSGLDPAFDYYYYVKAQNTQYTSDPSNIVNAFALAHPQKPNVTDVSETSYVANWDIHPKADRYEAHNYAVYEVPSGVNNTTVAFDDFEKIQNGYHPEAPEYDENIYKHRIDDRYTKWKDWLGQVPVYANGMIGGGYNEYYYGIIWTPEMNLNHADTYEVSLIVWATEGDCLYVRSETSRIEYYYVFSSTGFQELTMTFPSNENSRRERLRLRSDYYFLIDYFSVTQDVAEGDKIYNMCSWQLLEGNENDHCTFDNLAYAVENHNYAFDVKAAHDAFGDEYWSECSDYVAANMPLTVNEEKEGSLNLHPNPAIDRIRIEGLQEDREVRFYNTLGELVMTADANGSIDVSSLKQGVYVLQQGASKVRFVKK